MIRPTLERGTHFAGIARPIVNASDRDFVSRLMIKDSFNVVGLYA
jgi:hypothetical protein